MKRVLAVFLTVVMIVASVAVCPASSTYAAEFDGLKDGTNYIIVSKSSGMAMTVSGFSTENNANICQMPIGNYRSQIWTLEDAGDGYCRIVNQMSGKALNVPNKSTDADTQVIQWNKEKSDNSSWKLTKIADNSYRITSKHVEEIGFALGTKDDATSRGAAIVQNTYTGVDSELWEFQVVDDGDIMDYPETDAQEAVNAFLNTFVYEENGVRKLRKCGTIWSAAESTEVLLDIYERFGGEEYKKLVCDIVDWYIGNNGEYWAGNKFNDDVMWAVIMCARTYLLTGEEKYLTYAEDNFEMCYNRAWSEDLGGGLWWTTDNNTKNACVNGPGAVAACLLGEATGDETYYTKAKAIIDWEIATLLADDGGVWDSYNVKQEYNKWVSSYNQGTFIGACTMLYQHYSEQTYYECAKKAADRSMKLNLNGEQSGNDLIGFKGILARWLRYFVVNCNVDDYNEWMERSAASAWVNRNSDNLMWTQFGTVTVENIENYIATGPDADNDGKLDDKNIEEYAGWGCSSALSWLVNCTGVDARQEDEAKRTESLGMTAAKTAYEKTFAEAKVVYETGQDDYLASTWNTFLVAYNAAINLKENPTVAQIRAVQAALYEAYIGLKMKNPPNTTIEMESGERSSVANITNADNCSGGQYVGNVGGENNGAVTVIVTADKAGDHIISVQYCTWGDRQLNIQVNGTDNVVTCKGGSWTTPATNPAEVTVYMEKGENTIVFEGVADEQGVVANAPNLDCFSFQRTNSEANQAMDAAELTLAKEVLTATLEESEAVYEAGQGDYTADSWNVFVSAYEKAMNPPTDATTEELTKLTEELEEAKNSLEEKSESDNGNIGKDNETGDSGNTDETKGDETNGNTDETKGDETNGNTDETKGDEINGNADETKGDEINGNTDETKGDETNGNTDEPQDDVNNGQDDTIGEAGKDSETENMDKASNEIVEGSSVEQATQVITSNKTEDDLKGSGFAKLSLRVTKSTSKTQKLKWNKVNSADGYMIFGNKCGEQMKLLKTIKKSSTTSWMRKNLKKNTYYKYLILAYKEAGEEKVTLATSKTIHVSTTSGKYSDIKSVKVNKTKVALKKGKTFKIKAQEVKTKNKLKIKRHRKLYFESTNTKIAKVSKKGTITAKKKGTCYIYVYAQNGVFKKIEVRVK